jgi:hypothetical protein
LTNIESTVLRLWESFGKKRPDLWPDKWILHHDTAPAHDALRVPKFLAMKSVKILLSQSHYKILLSQNHYRN